ncbi:MAG: glycosyltransferase [Actinomycetota bacterium]|nr:glycosyltransferase [Actinomycetota bacterium]
MPVPLTAALICFNDSAHLGDTLDSVSFCSDVVIADLGSTDGSIDIARGRGARVFDHPWVPNSPMAREFLLSHVQTDWVVSLDPDMRFPAGAVDVIQGLITENPQLAIIGMPYQNYFGDKLLRYGRWGGIKTHFPGIVNQRRIEVIEVDHRGHYRPKPGFDYISLPPVPDMAFQHHWVESWQHLLNKQRLYLPGEVAARWDEGLRATTWSRVWRPLRTFLWSLVWRRGFLDGFTGIGLSAIAGWYEAKVQGGLAGRARVS